MGFVGVFWLYEVDGLGLGVGCLVWHVGLTDEDLESMAEGVCRGWGFVCMTVLDVHRQYRAGSPRHICCGIYALYHLRNLSLMYM